MWHTMPSQFQKALVGLHRQHAGKAGYAKTRKHAQRWHAGGNDWHAIRYRSAQAETSRAHLCSANHCGDGRLWTPCATEPPAAKNHRRDGVEESTALPNVDWEGPRAGRPASGNCSSTRCPHGRARGARRAINRRHRDEGRQKDLWFLDGRGCCVRTVKGRVRHAHTPCPRLATHRHTRHSAQRSRPEI